MRELSRRKMLQGVGLAVGTLTAAAALPGGVLDAPDATAADPTAPTSLSPEQAIARLATGNRRFVRGRLRHPRRDGPRLAAVAEGQAPFAIVLGCADSRVPPEVMYDQGLGDIFVARVAGNTATDPYILGSVEYGAAVLGAVALVVLGHEGCGAVKAAIDVAQNGTQLPGDIGAVVAPIVPLAQPLLATTAKDDLVQAVTLANIRHGVALLHQTPLLAGLVAQGKLQIAGGEYQLKTGRVIPVE